MNEKMPHTKTSMDAASYALWKELRAPCIKRLAPKAVFGTACCLLWLAAGLLYGKVGLLSLVLLLSATYLPVGFAHMAFGGAKDDWFGPFAPSFYLLSPLIGIFILCGQVVGVVTGMPLIPTILSGRNLAGITRDVDDGHGYRFTMTTGQSAIIIRDGVSFDPRRFYIPFNRRGLSGAVGDLTSLLMCIDEALLDAPTAGNC